MKQHYIRTQNCEIHKHIDVMLIHTFIDIQHIIIDSPKKD